LQINLKRDGVVLNIHSDTPLDIEKKNPSMIGGDFSGGDKKNKGTPYLFLSQNMMIYTACLI
jgi:hypothetical protein